MTKPKIQKIIQQHPFFTLVFSVVGFPELFFWGYHLHTLQVPGIRGVQMLFPNLGQYMYLEISSLGADNAEAVDSIPVPALPFRARANDPLPTLILCESLDE